MKERKTVIVKLGQCDNRAMRPPLKLWIYQENKFTCYVHLLSRQYIHSLQNRETNFTFLRLGINWL